VSSGPPGGGTWKGVALTALGLVVIIGIGALVPPIRDAVLDAARGDTGKVRDDLDDLGAEGALLIFALALVHVLVWFPAEILNAAAGFVYGFWAGLALVMAGWMVSGLLAYYVGQHAARPLLYPVVGEERFKRLEALVERGGITFLLAARLVPIVPFNLLGYVAGATHVPLPRYLWTTAVGFLPITAYFTYLGSRLEEFSLEDPVVWAGAIGLVIALVGIRYLRPGAPPEVEPDREPEPEEA
jgi:uncharacterized membrane protein YdjX (TVP38/TMEM64 family)